VTDCRSDPMNVRPYRSRWTAIATAAACVFAAGCGSTTVVTRTIAASATTASQAAQPTSARHASTKPRARNRHVGSQRAQHSQRTRHARPRAKPQPSPTPALTCNGWAGASTTTQTGVVQSLVGETNLGLRVKATTAACINDATDGQDPTAASVINSIASNYSTPVNIDESQLPPTLSPDDPDQCNERTDAAQGATNADWIEEGLADCVAMGY
jgi:hypothetical protein